MRIEATPPNDSSKVYLEHLKLYPGESLLEISYGQHLYQHGRFFQLLHLGQINLKISVQVETHSKTENGKLIHKVDGTGG